jgi:hypothetical protein
MAPAPYKIPPIQPFKALKALARLMLDPQDTRQAALLTVALRGRSEAALYERFKASPAGLRVLRQRRRLSDVLDDRVYLAGLPADSLGAHLLAYLESEGFTAKELGHVTRAATDDLVAATPKCGCSPTGCAICMISTTSWPAMGAMSSARFTFWPFRIRSKGCAASA